MMFIYLLASPFLASYQEEAALANFNQFLKNANQGAVSIEMRLNNSREPAKGEYEWIRPLTQRFVLSSGAFSYEFRQTPQGLIEWNTGSKIYEEHLPFSRLVPPRESISPWPATIFPWYLLSQNVQSWLPEGAKWQKTTVQGAEKELIWFVAAYREPTGQATLRLAIDPSGRPARIQLSKPGLGQEFRFSNWRKPAATLTKQSLQPPMGFMPMSLERGGDTLVSGQKVPLGQWLDENGRSRTDVGKLVQGKKTFLLVVSPDCAVCSNASKFFEKIAQLARRAGAQTIAVSYGQGKPMRLLGGWRVFWDRDGSIEKLIYTPGTPAYFVIDAKGQLVQMWMGYDPEKERALLQEFREAFESDES